MSASAVELIMAICAVLGSLGGTLLLSFRVGRLVGTVEGFMKASAADRQALHDADARTDQRLREHLNWHLGIGGR